VGEVPRGMGRGLAALLTPSSSTDMDFRRLPVDLIAANPNQPRRHFDEASLLSLADSLRERGVLQPVIVRPRPGGSYELIAGERRWRAAGMAGFDTVPAIVREQDDASTLELALIENMAREDLNPVEAARACSILVEELGITREELGRRLGRSRVAISNLMRLLDLPDEALELIAQGRLSEGHGRALLLASDHGDRRRLARLAADEGWTVRQTETRARQSGPDVDGEIRVRTRRRRFHPDHEEAAERLAEDLTRALGHEVEVTPSGGGCRVTLSFTSLDDATALAERLGAPLSSPA